MAETLITENSDRLCEYIAEQSAGVCLLSFSAGKDSIASWLQLRRFFKRIIPVHMYLVPGLSFEEKDMAYFEDYFGTHIYRMPHPSLYRMLNAYVFQPPERIKPIADLQLYPFGYDDVFNIVKAHEDLPFETYTAIGVRQTDSLNRWASIKKYGAANAKRRVFYPIYDWSKDRLLTEIKDAGIQLPMEYRVFGRSFDGIDYRFLKPIKDRFPRDYRKIIEYFPMAEMEVLRMEVREQYYD